MNSRFGINVSKDLIFPDTENDQRSWVVVPAVDSEATDDRWGFMHVDNSDIYDEFPDGIKMVKLNSEVEVNQFDAGLLVGHYSTDWNLINEIAAVAEYDGMSLTQPNWVKNLSDDDKSRFQREVNALGAISDDYSLSDTVDNESGNKKYELTDDTIEVHGRTLYRIRALKDFNPGDPFRLENNDAPVVVKGSPVHAGDLGGYVESEANLSQDGDCWIGDHVWVFENAEVSDNAYVCCNNLNVPVDSIEIFGDAKISGNAGVSGRNVMICDNVHILDNAQVIINESSIENSVVICGNACVHGFDVGLYDNAKLSGNAVVDSEYFRMGENAKVGGNVEITADNCLIHGYAEVFDNAKIENGPMTDMFEQGGVFAYDTSIGGSAIIHENARVRTSNISGNAVVCGDADVCLVMIQDDAQICGNAKVYGDMSEHDDDFDPEKRYVIVDGDTRLDGDYITDRDKKYELTDKTIEYDDHTLYQIRALKDFETIDGTQIHAGDLGGYVESEDNLSQEGKCWIGCDDESGNYAVVYENARIYDNALILAGAVHNDAEVYENATIDSEYVVPANLAEHFAVVDIAENAKIFGNARVLDSRVRGDAKVYDNAYVHGNSLITDQAEVYDDAEIKLANISDDVKVYNNAKLSGGDVITHDTAIVVNGNKEIGGNEIIKSQDEVDAIEDTKNNDGSKRKVDKDAYYELTDDMIEYKGHTLHRIRALYDLDFAPTDGWIPCVGIKKGTLGGYVESKDNLSAGILETDEYIYSYGDLETEDGCLYTHGHDNVLYTTGWVGDEAMVYGNAKVYGFVTGNAEVYDNAQISSDGWVDGNAKVYDNAVIERARVTDNAQIHGNATLTECLVGDDMNIDRDLMDDDSIHAYLTGVPTSLIRDSRFTSGAKDIFIPDENTPAGYGCIEVSPSQMFPSKDENDVLIPGKMDIMLADPNVTIPYSIPDAKMWTYSGGYRKISDIVQQWNDDREIEENKTLDNKSEQKVYSQDEETMAVNSNGVDSHESENTSTEESSAKSSNRVYLNRVPEKLIHNASNPNVYRISIADERASDNFGNIYVKSSQVFAATTRQGVPISGMKNVALGSADRSVNYTFLNEDGTYTTEKRNVEDIAEQWKNNQNAYYEAVHKAESDKTIEASQAFDDASFEK